MSKTIVKLLCTMMWLVASVGASAQETITIMVSSIDKHIYLPAKLAEQLGYLKETGLDVVLLSTTTGSNAEKEMLSGVAQGVIGFYDHAVVLQARGKLVQSVVQFAHSPGEAILLSKAAAKEVRTLSDLRNKTLGVTGLGSSTHILTQYLLGRAGVKHGEFTPLPVGHDLRFINAMNKGKIVAGMTTQPTITRLTSSGAAQILVDLQTLETTEAVLGGPYPGACLYMPTAWVNKNKDAVRKIVNAFVKTLRYIDTHSAEEIAEKMPPEYYSFDKNAYIEALRISKRMFTSDGLMPPRGPATVLAVLKDSAKALQGKTINLDNTYTNEFARAALP